MIREEAINRAANDAHWGAGATSTKKRKAFIRGAQWADKYPSKSGFFDFSDKELVNELRKRELANTKLTDEVLFEMLRERGYTGKLYKQTECEV